MKNTIYKVYRNFSLFHIYRLRPYGARRVRISRETYRQGRDGLLREINDVSGFGCTCESLKQAERYILYSERWKESGAELFSPETGKPYRRGVRHEFLSEDKPKGSS